MHILSLDEGYRNLRIAHIHQRQELTNHHPVDRGGYYDFSEAELKECCNDAEWQRILEIVDEIRKESGPGIMNLHYGITSHGMISVSASQYCLLFSSSWFEKPNQ